MNRCPSCQEDTLQEQLVETWLQRSGNWVLIRNAAALVCDNCGDKFFSQETAERLAELADPVRREVPTAFIWCPVFDLRLIEKQLAERTRPFFVTTLEATGVFPNKRVLLESDNIVRPIYIL